MTVIAPVSAGGHLDEMLRLLPRIADVDSTLFVTYDVPQARALVPSSSLQFAHHPTTKNLPNAVRNYRLARRLLSERDIDRVISTGAAVAVPFIIRAHRLGIPCHYIESATRVDGPSLSGRMLQPLKSVYLYRQLGDWGRPRWRQGPCVFDGFTVSYTEARPLRRILVSLGTHGFAFRALVDRVARCLRGIGGDLEILWQLGSTPDPGGLPGRVVKELPVPELKAAIADADLAVGHAGVGFALMALQARTVPLLVPRRRARREHTDDHQVQLAHELNGQGLAVASEVGQLTLGHLEHAAELDVKYDEPNSFELVD